MKNEWDKVVQNNEELNWLIYSWVGFKKLIYENANVFATDKTF